MADISAELISEPDAMIEGQSATIRIISSDDTIKSVKLKGVDGGVVQIDSVGDDLETFGFYGDYNFIIHDNKLIDDFRTLSIEEINGSTNISSHTFSTPIISYPVIDLVQESRFDLSAVEDHYDEVRELTMYRWRVDLENSLNFDLRLRLYWHGWVTIKAGDLFVEVVNEHPVDAIMQYSPRPVFEKIKPSWWTPVSLLDY